MQWEAKAPSEIVERYWEVPTLDDDSLASFVASATGVTIDSEETDGDLITLTLSAGTADATATVSFVATTTNGLILTEVFYLPIRENALQITPTVRDVCNFALRKATGNTETATASEIEDAAERLTDMLAGWAGEGADLQVKLPCEPNDTLSIPDWAVGPVKACLTAEVFDFYDIPLTSQVAIGARKGLQRIKHNLLPEEREGAEFF